MPPSPDFLHSSKDCLVFEFRNKTALITGASSGIGQVFARQLARLGTHVILVARNETALRALAEELQAEFRITASVVPADLSQPDAAQTIGNATRQQGLQVDLLINNAGFLTHGHFETLPPEREQAQVMVNTVSMVTLCREYLPGMLERKSGGIINVASIAGFQPIPYMATYAATKAFVISFSVALQEECRGRHVHVLTLCPGTTSTHLFDAAPLAALGAPRSSEQVVATAIRAFQKGRSLVIDGTKNSLLSHGPRLIPKWFAARCAGGAVHPKKGEH